MELHIFHYFAIPNHSIGEFLQFSSQCRSSPWKCRKKMLQFFPNVFPHSFFFRYPNQTLSRISSNLIVPDIPPIFLVFRNFRAVGGNAKKSFIFIDDCFAWRFFQKQFRSSMNERPGCPAIKWKSQNTGPGNPIYETVTPATVESSLKNHHRIKSSCLSTM